MIIRNGLILATFVFTTNLFCQTNTGFDQQSLDPGEIYQVPDIDQMDLFLESLINEHGQDILTGYSYSVFAEPVSDAGLEYSVSGDVFYPLKCDATGKFFIQLKEELPPKVHIRSTDKNYHPFDTLVNLSGNKNHIAVELSPRHKIVIRGRVYIGSLAAENIDVDIIHLADTFRLKTLGCYLDNEDYWNCLYRGMFKQPIIFDTPEDSVKVTVRKNGFLQYNKSLSVSGYDGTVLPLKLEYDRFLVKFPKHNLSLKFVPPVFNLWLFGIDYTYTPKIGNFSRIGIGFESAMLISNIESKLNTSPDAQPLPDSILQKNYFDSTYNFGYFMPHLTFWLTNPERRAYSLYTGIGAPFTIPGNKIYLQPYLGGRFYLDINKAFLFEIKYLTYDLEVKNYYFNLSGNATEKIENQHFNKLVFALGLQISF